MSQATEPTHADLTRQQQALAIQAIATQRERLNF
jgi:hypothetical protein